jgi:hypothetical protein
VEKSEILDFEAPLHLLSRFVHRDAKTCPGGPEELSDYCFFRSEQLQLCPEKTVLQLVVIDHELRNDIAASALRQRFITLNLNEDAATEAVVMELTGLFRVGSVRRWSNICPCVISIAVALSLAACVKCTS